MIESIVSQIGIESRRIWCYRWLAAAVFVPTLAVGTAVVMRTPQTYQSTGQILVNQQSVLLSTAKDVALGSSVSPKALAVSPNVLLNDSSLRKVVAALDDGKVVRTAAQTEQAAQAIRDAVTVSPADDDGFVEFAAKDKDPVRAKRIVFLLMQQFINLSTGRSQGELGQTGKFLDAAATAYRDMIAKSSAQMDAFRSKHRELELSTVEPSVAVVKATDEVVAVPVSTPPVLSAEDEQIATLKSDLAKLRLEYTDQYPDVVSLRKQIANLEKANAAQRELAKSAGAAPVKTAAIVSPTAAASSLAPTKVRKTVRRVSHGSVNLSPAETSGEHG